jgi:hypothetical protein
MENNMDLSLMEKVVVRGDLSSLKPEERFVYYTKVCESVGLNPLTKPFDYLQLDGKLVLYAKRDATDQLRKIHDISITITSREKIGEVYCVTARGTTKDGRTDESIGAVALMKEEKIWDEMRKRKVPTGRIVPLTADELANAIMKAETKAKRRVTLSLSGLGMMDESEIETVEGAERIEVGEGAEMGNQEKLISQTTSTTTNSSQTQKTQTQNKTAAKNNKNNTNKEPAKDQQQAGERYKLLDMATGTSPGGVTFAKLRVLNLVTEKQDYVIARSPETIEQVTAINNNDQFELNIELDNGFKIVSSVRIVEAGEAA